MRTLYQDLRYGFRVLKASPGFTVVAVLTLAIGIAANTTVFGWIDTLLLNPLPGVADGSRLATLETVAPNGEFSNTAYRDYQDYRDHLTLVSGLAASLLNGFNVGTDQNPQRVWGEYVSGNYFDVLGVKPVLGRTFLRSEYGDRPGAYPVAILGHNLWTKRFRSDPGVIGKTIRVNRHVLTIIGVAPPEFRGTIVGLAVNLWVPMVMAPQLNGQGEWLLTSRGQRHMWVTARLKPGVSMEQARAELKAGARRLSELAPETNAGFSASLMPVRKGHVGAHALLYSPLEILMAVCGVLFLIVAANVANLQLVRASARHKELGIRMAVGAGSGRLIRQLLTESLLLAFLGALVGIPLSQWAGPWLVWLLPPTNLPILVDAHLNLNILLFTLLLCTAAAVLTGLAPAWHAVRTDLNETLKENGRGSTSSARLHRTRGLLVISEVALALVALVGTGLFARSFQNASAISPGLDAHNVLLAQYQVANFCKDAAQRMQFCVRMHERLAALPGVADVGYADMIPLTLGSSPWSEVAVDGYVPKRGEDMRVLRNIASPGFLPALKIPILEGRNFTEQDDRGKPLVLIVNQAFAQRYFAGASPVGRKVRLDGDPFTIVGMARDSKYHVLTEGPTPAMYAAFRQYHGGEFWVAFFIRTAGAASRFVPAIRRTGAALEPDAGVSEVVSYEEHIAGCLYPQKVAATLLSVLGGISLLLAAVGLYSVLAYTVSQRTHEFGVRMALGAGPGSVLAMVIRQGLGLTALGLATGTAAAISAARLVGGLLVRISAVDPGVLGGAALFLALVALLASYLPARRATKVSPAVALGRE